MPVQFPITWNTVRLGPGHRLARPRLKYSTGMDICKEKNQRSLCRLVLPWSALFKGAIKFSCSVWEIYGILSMEEACA